MDINDACQSSSTGYATILSGTPIIVLCPRFWSLAATPSRKNCLTTTNTAGNGFVGSGFDVISNSKIYVLLCKLARYYLYVARYSFTRHIHCQYLLQPT